MAQPIGDPARDERELTQLVKDLNEAVVKADVAVLDRVLHEDYVHHRPRGMVEDRRSTSRTAKPGAWISSRSCRTRSRCASTAIPPS